jgi:hypothetical protein
MTTKQKLTMKKIEEAKKREEELKKHSAAEFQANQTIGMAAKQRNELGGVLQTEKLKGEQLVVKTNKAIS